MAKLRKITLGISEIGGVCSLCMLNNVYQDLVQILPPTVLAFVQIVSTNTLFSRQSKEFYDNILFLDWFFEKTEFHL